MLFPRGKMRMPLYKEKIITKGCEISGSLELNVTAFSKNESELVT